MEKEKDGGDVDGQRAPPEAAEEEEAAEPSSEAEAAATAEVTVKGGKVSNWHPAKASALAGALDKHVHFAGAAVGLGTFHRVEKIFAVETWFD